MKETKALINDATGLVENIIVMDGKAEYAASPGKTLMDAAGAEIGGTWDGAKFLPPPDPPPPPPLRFEAQAKVIEADTSLEPATKAVLAAMARAL